ncbi:hypothetical protein AU255_04960 [Methyloprofundus sedimenti]|uniref:Uncharacterized protein n=1 Tax=Methyloprofundus sedimenti TaxID=1420851 RepID=A0A1V8M6P8_9GAMM|nr:hypothetical protein [Methyloprofundus sedimenti]OQK17244.1 hypothetical protein AU255_04960 [Methyloprofundus sedimenti]
MLQFDGQNREEYSRNSNGVFINNIINTKMYLLNVTRNNEPFVLCEYETEEQAVTALEALLDQYGDEITYTLDEQA